MSNAPISDNELPPTGDPLPEEEPSWLERLLARFGLGEEPDLREVIEDALARGKEAGGDTFSAQERAMLRNSLRLGKLTVEDVMVPPAIGDEVLLVISRCRHGAKTHGEPCQKGVGLAWVLHADSPRAATGPLAAHDDVAADVDQEARDAARAQCIGDAAGDVALGDPTEVDSRLRVEPAQRTLRVERVHLAADVRQQALQRQ